MGHPVLGHTASGTEAGASALLQVGLQGQKWFLGQASLQSHVPSKPLKMLESQRFPAVANKPSRYLTGNLMFEKFPWTEISVIFF